MSDKFIKIINKVSIYTSPEHALRNIEVLGQTQPVRTIGFVNAHAFNLAERDDDFYQSVLNLDVVLRDGSGVKMLCKHLGVDPGYNLNGTDFIPQLIGCLANNKKIALFGTTTETIQQAIPSFESYGVEVISFSDGFQSIDHYVDKIKQCPDVGMVILGMGMPKQERVAVALKPHMNDGVVVCGGAIIDFMSGKVARSPQIFRTLGIEWIYRLSQEPRRLFQRYVIGNVIFIRTMLKTKKMVSENA